MPWVLVVDDEDLRGRWPLVEELQVAGSGPDADLPLDHLTVSRKHAELSPEASGVWVKDLGSSNGTRVDGVPIASRTLVAAGQSLAFGSLTCRLEVTDLGELEPALEFESDEEVRGAGRDGRTLSVSSARAFVDALFEVVARLEDVLEGSTDEPSVALALVHAAGRTVFDALPCSWLEIQESRDDAILFRAGDLGTALADSSESADLADLAASVDSVRSGSLETRIRFAAGAHREGLVPLVRLATQLAALGWPKIPPPRQEVDGEKKSSSQDAASRLPEPVTVDPVLRAIYDDARRVARGDVGVLIEGESGTGKELLARFLHSASRRSGNQRVTLNCAALPRDLLEAELFGIERGVATGVEARAGRFESADGGTLFLDEIGDMALETQAKILRVLQEGTVYRLGGSSPRPARVRVIAATHRDLRSMIGEGTFRLDLYHRIADCRFRLPPLRERLGDLPNLAAHFLMRAAKNQGMRPRGISRAALESLRLFPWPGNVRQLEREMSRAALFLEDGELLQNRHLQEEIRSGDLASRAGNERSLKTRLESYERGLIVETLARHLGQVRSAAEELGVGRTTLYRRIRELGIEP